MTTHRIHDDLARVGRFVHARLVWLVLVPVVIYRRVLSPMKTLERGYAIVRTDSHVLKDASAVDVGAMVDVRVASGSFDARVEEVHAE